MSVIFILRCKTYLKSITMSNRVQYFIRNILQNSKLNREKFANNKKIYSQLISKNRQNNSSRIITRKMSTYSQPLSFGDGPKGPKGPNWNPFIYMFMLSMGIYIPSQVLGKKK